MFSTLRVVKVKKKDGLAFIFYHLEVGMPAYVIGQVDSLSELVALIPKFQLMLTLLAKVKPQTCPRLTCNFPFFRVSEFLGKALPT
jgi:hypothetical protein